MLRPEWKVKAVAAAEVTALAGLAAEVRRWCFHRSTGVLTDAKRPSQIGKVS